MPDESVGVDSDNALAAALAYAALRWVPVPTPSGSKHPRLPNWQLACPGTDTILDWWGSRYHTDGISIVTGPSGLVVLDVDCHGPIDGEDTLADLCATYEALPDVPCVLTGGGGRHLYFAAPSGVTITNDAGRRLGPGLDIRAEGGQVVAPPSMHGSGRRYEWEASSLPALPSLFSPPEPNYVALPQLPEWLVALLTAEPPEPERLPVPQGNGHLPGQQWAAVTDWVSLLTADGATFMGARRDHRTGSSYSLWARPGADHPSASLGYAGSDVLKVFSTNWEGLDPEATYTKFGYLAAIHHGGDFSAARRALEAEGFRLDDLERLIPKARPPLVFKLGALRASDEPEYDWLVPDLIERGDRIIISGDEGQGKSTLLRQFGLAAAAGINPFGPSLLDRHPERQILLVDCENSRRQLRREFPKAWRALEPHQLAITDEGITVAVRTEGLALDDVRDRAGDRAWLIELIEELAPDLLLIGPLYKLLGGDPNAETESRETARFLDKLRGEDADMAVVIEAHAPHDAKRPFGWSGWKRWPEFGFHLGADGGLAPFRGGRDDSRRWPRQLRKGGEEEWPWLPDAKPAPSVAKTEENTPEAMRQRVLKVLHDLYEIDSEEWFPMPDICERVVGVRTGRPSNLVRMAVTYLFDRGWLRDSHTERRRGVLTMLTQVFQWNPDGPGE